MNGKRFVTLITALGVTSLLSEVAWAGSQDEFLREVHSVLRITGANIQWVPNGVGGTTPMLVYDVTNVTNSSVLVPVTVLAGMTGSWAGVREHWIERLDPDPTIPAIPRGIARRGRQYAYGGGAVQWPGQSIAPRGFQRFSQPIGIGGFPSGRYAIYVEYKTTHKQNIIQSEVVYFNVP